MKKLLTAVVLTVAPWAGFAATYTFDTGNLFNGNFATATAAAKANAANYSGLGNMAHGTAYFWGLSGNTDPENSSQLWDTVKNSGAQITSATLTIKNIWDWTGEG